MPFPFLIKKQELRMQVPVYAVISPSALAAGHCNKNAGLTPH